MAPMGTIGLYFFFSSRRRHTRLTCDWSSDVCSSDLARRGVPIAAGLATLEAIRRPEEIGFTRRLLWGRVPPLVSPVALFAPDGLALLPTPGHASDHMVVWDAERETLFAGDLFLGVKVRAAHPGENVRQLV